MERAAPRAEPRRVAAVEVDQRAAVGRARTAGPIPRSTRGSRRRSSRARRCARPSRRLASASSRPAHAACASASPARRCRRERPRRRCCGRRARRGARAAPRCRPRRRARRPASPPGAAAARRPPRPWAQERRRHRRGWRSSRARRKRACRRVWHGGGERRRRGSGPTRRATLHPTADRPGRLSLAHRRPAKMHVAHSIGPRRGANQEFSHASLCRRVLRDRPDRGACSASAASPPARPASPRSCSWSSSSSPSPPSCSAATAAYSEGDRTIAFRPRAPSGARGLVTSAASSAVGVSPSAASVATAAAGARSLAPLMKNMNTSRGCARRRRRLDARQPGRLARPRPRRARAPPRRRCRRAGSRSRAATRSHQARIDEVAGGVGERRVLVGVGEHRRDAVAARQRQVLRRHEARVPHLHRVAQRQAAEPLRQQLQEGLEVDRVELLGRSRTARRSARASVRARPGRCRRSARSIRRPRPSTRRLVAKRDRLDREDEVVGRGVAPLGEAGRRSACR